MCENPRKTHDTVVQDLKNHPERHHHSFAGLNECCTIGSAIDLGLIDAHSRLVDLGTNGGVRCDTRSGPCACGAWH